MLPRCPALALVLWLALLSGLHAEDAGSPRERISLNDDWRFAQGDPAGNNVDLRYDVRPEVKDARDDKAADSRPEEAERARVAAATVLKPWILPTGNTLIKDPARRYRRPEGDPGSNVPYVRPDFDDSQWRRITLPHDWAIEGPFLQEGDFGGMGRLPSWGVAWYRRKLELSRQDAGKRIVLEIDGAMSYASVWVNGHLAGGWPYGYSSWQIDITPHVALDGPNQIAIRLDNPPSSSRWYPGGGIYRNVWLTKTRPVHVAQWGTYVTTPRVTAEEAAVNLSVHVSNESDADARVRVETTVFVLNEKDEQEGPAVTSSKPEPLALTAHGDASVELAMTIRQPRLWGPRPHQTPHRYLAVTTVKRDGETLDRYETKFGVRSFTLDPVKGLSVNGKPLRIQGVNMHHDLGSLGAAFNTRAAERQLEMLQEMGCNAVRLSHNPPAPELLDLLDRMGFIVMDEPFDCWERKKTPLDFHLIFPDWHEQDLRAMLRRDRNHPSIFFWSIGNEVGEQYTDAAGAAIAKQLYDIVKEEDTTRPVTCAMNFAKPDMPLPAVLDVIGLNYQGEGIRQDPEFEGTDRIRTAPQYPKFLARFPDKPIISTETASAFSTRGAYLFPVSQQLSAPVRDGRGGDSVRHYVSAYELHAVDFGSSAEKVFRSLDQHPFVAGEFVWTGWDHLGEPTPYYTSRSAYSGIIDLAGFKKDRFWLYQARWRPELPMAHILPHWTWPERIGQVTPIHVFTSGDEAELFLNGRSLGRKKMQPQEYRLRWDDVVYEPGRVEVIAYKAGKVWARDAMETAFDPALIELTVDHSTLLADGKDLAFITARLADPEGRTAPTANNPIRFQLDGPADLIATDNGDQTSFTSFQSPVREAFNGYALAIVRSRKGASGKVTVTATSPNLEAGSVTVELAGQP